MEYGLSKLNQVVVSEKDDRPGNILSFQSMYDWIQCRMSEFVESKHNSKYV